jgi:hypothetical protein
MRIRVWLIGLLLAGMCAAWEPAPAQAGIWPFSMFSAKKPPAKKVKTKPRKPAYGTRTKAVKPVH